MGLRPFSNVFVLATLVLSTHAWISADVQAASLSPAPEDSFSIVVIPDTQGYRSEDDAITNPVFEAHTKWIAENIVSQRIAFVSHVGDIVDKNINGQWEVARQQMERLHGHLPYGISVGNHDMSGAGNSTVFQTYFGADRYKDMPWYGESFTGDPERKGHSGNNANSVQFFSAGGMNFMVLHLECNAPDNVLAWADKLLEDNKERWAIVTTHMYLGPLEKPKDNAGYTDDPKGVMKWTKRHGERGNSGVAMWEKLFSKHANILMIFCGDQSRSSAMYIPQTGAHGNTVHALLSDYTSSGPLRIYRFLPKAGAIKVMTYDTTLGVLIEDSKYVSGREHHQFTIHLGTELHAP